MAQSKGYTLIEVTFVILILSVLMSIAPLLFKSKAMLSFECERIKDTIVAAKYEAIKKRATIPIAITQDRIIIGNWERIFSYGISCSPYDFHFNGKGNVNMANTITCYYLNEKKEIVVNLGNGYIYVR